MNSRTKTDDQIIQLLHNKNKQGISDIYDKYGAALYGIILQIVPSEDLAKEVLKKTLIEAWERSKQYNPDTTKLFTWLLHISRHLSITALQTKKNQGSDKSLVVGNSVYKVNSQKNTKHHALKIVINKLDKKHQEVINLIYLQGYNLKEVEQILQLPLETIKLRIRLATKELRKVMKTNT